MTKGGRAVDALPRFQRMEAHRPRLRPKRAQMVVSNSAVPIVYRVREMNGIFMKKKNRKTSVAPPKMMPDFFGLRHSSMSSTA